MYLNVPKNAAVYILLTADGGVMSNEFYSVIDLPPAQFHQAYPLIQVSGADFTLDQWLEYANGLHEGRDKGAGIPSAVSEDAYCNLCNAELQSCRYSHDLPMPTFIVEILNLESRIAVQRAMEWCHDNSGAETPFSRPSGRF